MLNEIYSSFYNINVKFSIIKYNMVRVKFIGIFDITYSLWKLITALEEKRVHITMALYRIVSLSIS